jgi:hypothetical protein
MRISPIAIDLPHLAQICLFSTSDNTLAELDYQ